MTTLTPPRIVLLASISWTLWNYRLNLIRELEAAGYEVILIAAEDSSRSQLQAHTRAGFYPLQQMSRSSLSVIQNLKLLIELYSVFRRVRPQLALMFTIRPNTFGNFAAAFAGIPTLSTVEGMGISGSAGGWLRGFTNALYTLAFKHTRKVIFLNRDDLDDFVRQGIVQDRKTCLIRGPGVDTEHFKPQATSRENGALKCLFIGRLLSEKGIREFAEAARRFKSAGKPAVFQVLGKIDSGNPTSIRAEELQSWIQQGHIEYLGFHEDVRPFLAQSDVAVLPSYYREGVPRSLLEAMAMEKPVITTDNVGCRDTVNGKNGYLVPLRNVDALCAAMEDFLALSPEQRAEMGRESLQLVEIEFSDRLVLPQYLQLIRDILAERK